MLFAFITTYVRQTRDQAERATDLHRANVSAAESDRRMVVVFGTVLLSLLCIRFFGSPERPELVLETLSAIGLPELSAQLGAALTSSPEARLHQRIYWASFRLLAYGLLPWCVVRWVLRRPLREFGTGLHDLGKHAPIYLGILALLLPVVFAASFGQGFQAKYPYYRLAPGEPLWPRFVGWELLYAAQFVALEFFFRGFMVHGLAPRLGYGAVFAMMVPYMMIHYGKPLPEAVGSIVAGFTLGTLSLRSCSIWWGALVHIVVACSMDLLSLWHRGLLY